MLTKEREKEIYDRANELAKKLGSLTPPERVRVLIDSLESIKPEYPVKIIVMSKPFFAEWYYYCEENNLDYKEIEGCKVMLDKTQPFQITAIVGHR